MASKRARLPEPGPLDAVPSATFAQAVERARAAAGGAGASDAERDAEAFLAASRAAGKPFAIYSVTVAPDDKRSTRCHRRLAADADVVAPSALLEAQDSPAALVALERALPLLRTQNERRRLMDAAALAAMQAFAASEAAARAAAEDAMFARLEALRGSVPVRLRRATIVDVVGIVAAVGFRRETASAPAWCRATLNDELLMGAHVQGPEGLRRIERAIGNGRSEGSDVAGVTARRVAQLVRFGALSRALPRPTRAPLLAEIVRMWESIKRERESDLENHPVEAKLLAKGVSRGDPRVQHLVELQQSIRNASTRVIIAREAEARYVPPAPHLNEAEPTLLHRLASPVREFLDLEESLVLHASDEDFYHFSDPRESMRGGFGRSREEMFSIRNADEDGAVVAALCTARGLDLEARVTNGWTALHLAARNCRVAVAHALLAGGASPNAAAHCNGFTPLHEAVVHFEGRGCGCGGGSNSGPGGGLRARDCCGRPLLRMLCEARGVNLAARDRRGWTPLRWAREKGEEEVVAALMRFGAAE